MSKRQTKSKLPISTAGWSLYPALRVLMTQLRQSELLPGNKETFDPLERHHYCLIWIQQGKGAVVKTRGSEYRIPSGSFILVDYGSKTEVAAAIDSRLSYFAFYFEAWFPKQGWPLPREVPPIRSYPDASNLLIQLSQALQRASDLSEPLRTGLTSICAQTLFAFFLTDQGEVFETTRPETTHPTVAQAIKLMHVRASQSTDSWGLRDLAQELHISRVHLIRLFNISLGTTPSHFFKIIRMERAANYLKDMRMLIKEVAERCGSSDQFHFSRAFKSVYGFSPSQYRLMLKRGEIVKLKESPAHSDLRNIGSVDLLNRVGDHKGARFAERLQAELAYDLKANSKPYSSIKVAKGKWKPIDMRSLVNLSIMSKALPWNEGGRSLHFNATPTLYHGIPFDVIDESKNNGRNILVFRSNKMSQKEIPTEITLSQVENSRGLYLLATCCWVKSCIAQIATIEVTFTDGLLWEAPIYVLGRTDLSSARSRLWNNRIVIQDWWNNFNQWEGKRSKKVTLINPVSPLNNVGYVYTCQCIFPSPRVPVEFIRIRSVSDSDATFVVLGITMLDSSEEGNR